MIETATTQQERAAVAERIVLALLRERGLEAASAVPTGRSGERCPDIVIGPPHHRDVEVSMLDLPRTWTDAHELGDLLRNRLHAVMLEEETAAAVTVELKGYARTLLDRVPAVVDAFRRGLVAGRLQSIELVPGFVFTIEAARIPFVHVVGATVYGADDSRNESVSVRMWSKMDSESVQVRDGGIVLIWTTELLTRALAERGEEKSIYESVRADLVKHGELHRHVAAYGVLEIACASALSAAEVQPPAEVRDSQEGAIAQRLLWVPNPHAARPLDRDAVHWFAPPYPIMPCLRTLG